MYPYQPPPPPQVVHVYHQPQKSAGVAAILEVLPGFLIQTFGIGHLYAGNIGLGLFFMFGYWAITFVNFLLCFIFIGFITWPICWIFMMIMSPILASNAANVKNSQAQQQYSGPPMYR
ncbi:MAG: hypothetical protein ABIP75_07645 [Pyrinomonadaceae bacterium]